MDSSNFLFLPPNDLILSVSDSLSNINKQYNHRLNTHTYYDCNLYLLSISFMI